jgi:hypothetical protein
MTLTFLASRKGIAILLLVIAVALLANALLYWVAPQAEARARVGEEVEVVPLTGEFKGIHNGHATIYGCIKSDGSVRIGYYEIDLPTGATEAIVYHSTAGESIIQGVRAP